MLDALLVKLENDLRATSEASVTQLIATARTQLEGALAEVDKERARGLAEVSEERAELQREIEGMQTHKEQQMGRVDLNVGGHRFETSVQTLRQVPGNIFDAYFSGRYAQDACTDGSIFIDRDGELFAHVLQYMRDGILAVVEHNELPVVGLLRRLKREFSYFSIELHVEQADGAEQVELFDTLIAAAYRRDEEHEGEAAAMSDECRASDDDDNEKSVVVDNEESMEAANRIREATRRNQARRDALGEAATHKWCSQCLEDKELDVFRKDVSNKMFGRKGRCKACLFGATGLTGPQSGDVTLAEDRGQAFESAAEGSYSDQADQLKIDEHDGEETKVAVEELGQAAAINEENEDTESDDDEEKADEKSETTGIMTAAERSREATVRNQARRDAGYLEGEEVSFKWCSQCFEDKTLNMFHKDAKRMFGRKGRCKACLSEDARFDQLTKSTKMKTEEAVEPIADDEQMMDGNEDKK
jgi:hypothetical protein